jgi:hypothetical protein
MINSLFQHKIVIVVIIIIVIAGAWFGLSSSSGAPASDTALTSTGADTTGGDSDIVSSLYALQAITLSGTIFTNPAYTTLQDFTTAIVPEPAGRSDPFAPITAQSVATSTKSAQIFKPAQ